MFICMSCDAGAHEACTGIMEVHTGFSTLCDCAILDPDGKRHPKTVSQDEE